jgi:hypothetical protein
VTPAAVASSTDPGKLPTISKPETTHPSKPKPHATRSATATPEPTGAAPSTVVPEGFVDNPYGK